MKARIRGPARGGDNDVVRIKPSSHDFTLPAGPYSRPIRMRDAYLAEYGCLVLPRVNDAKTHTSLCEIIYFYFQQPLNILQRRLLETNLSRCRLNNRGTKPPNNGIGLLSIGSVVKQKDSLLPEENDYVFVWCKCSGRDMKVLIDTGCRLNLVSSASVEWLGLKEMVNANKMEAASLPSHRNLRAQGQIDKLNLTIGQVLVESTMTVVENEKHFMSLGSRTLKALKCVIDMEKQTLMLGKVEREIVQFVDGKIGSQDESPSQV